jgi:ribonuclease P protein component
VEKAGSRRTRSAARLEIIKKRADFLAAQSGERAGSMALLVIRSKTPKKSGSARIGFTVTKKLGGAVTRNRIRRRLKEVARQVFPEAASPGYDYVVIARPQAETREFSLLLDDMKRALLRLAALPK